MGQPLARLERETQFDPRWAEYHNRVVAFMAAVGGLDRDTARDLAQDVLLKVLRIEPGAGLPAIPLLYAAARNRLTDWFRSEGRRRARRADFEDADTVAGHYPGPCEEAEQRSLRRQVGRFLDALPAREREVAFLRFFEGMRHREIASATRLPTGTVKFLVHEIRRGLRAALEEDDEA